VKNIKDKIGDYFKMIASIYTASIIKPGLARVSLSVFDDSVHQGDYEVTITVTLGDNVNTLENKVIAALREAMSTPVYVFNLNGREIQFEYAEQQELPLGDTYKRAVAQ
jgi:hypothetical protein